VPALGLDHKKCRQERLHSGHIPCLQVIQIVRPWPGAVSSEVGSRFLKTCENDWVRHGGRWAIFHHGLDTLYIAAREMCVPRPDAASQGSYRNDRGAERSTCDCLHSFVSMNAKYDPGGCKALRGGFVALHGRLELELGCVGGFSCPAVNR
jgi:hypothetical protein